MQTVYESLDAIFDNDLVDGEWGVQKMYYYDNITINNSAVLVILGTDVEPEI